jgi:hypothetical protein
LNIRFRLERKRIFNFASSVQQKLDCAYFLRKRLLSLVIEIANHCVIVRSDMRPLPLVEAYVWLVAVIPIWWKRLKKKTKKLLTVED